jgi:hypothetical protein
MKYNYGIEVEEDSYNWGTSQERLQSGRGVEPGYSVYIHALF